MRHRSDDKVARAAHIKPNTRGSSNEISFSVLDAKVGGGGEDSARTFRKIPLFTLSQDGKVPSDDFIADGAPKTQAKSPGRPSTALSGGTWQTPVDEVRRRKSSRQRRRFAIIGVIVCACLVLIGLTAGAVMSFLHAQDERKSELVGLLETVKACDETMLPFDEMVSNQITRKDVSLEHEQEMDRAYREMGDDLDSAMVTLATCKAQAASLEEELFSADDKECVNEVISSINARLNMMEIGTGILADTLPGYIAAARAEQGWESLLAADAAARQAAETLSSMSTDTVKASKELSETALEGFVAARDNFNKAAAWAEAEMLPYIAYCQLRIDAQNAAIASDEAYLARDRATMSEQNDLYNELDAQAAAAAANVATDPATLFERKIDDLLGDTVALYTSERQKAGNADAVLRDYLSSAE